MAEANRPHPSWLRLAALFLCAGPGVICILGAFDIGPLGPEDINGPPWIGALAGSLFVLLGAALFCAGSERLRRIAPYFGVLILTGFALIGNWVAFGEGPRRCSGGVSLLFLSASGTASEIECRAAFGYGAVLLDATLVWFLGAQLEQLGARRLGALVQKAGKGVFFLALLPLLLVAIAVQWAQSLARRRRRMPPQ